ncbi:MAG: OmpA family protein [Bacteroidetes bacterium]|nr:OmpA family protein [Bacteroidota bacterium]
MKNSFLIIILSVFSPVLLNAQFGSKLLDKVKNKVNQRVDQKTDKAIDKTLDKAEGKDQPANNGGTASGTTAPADANGGTAKTEVAPIKSYSSYDFVPGEQVLYSTSFEGENSGELPLGWNSNGNSSVVTLSGKTGNWLRIQQNTVVLTDNKKPFTDNCTVEFDLVFVHHFNGMVLPSIAFGLMSSGDLSTTDNALLVNYKKTFAAELGIQPGTHQDSHVHLQSFAASNTFLTTQIKQLAQLQTMYDGMHVAIQVQKERLRLWLNGQKLYDIPKGIAEGTVLNQLFFSVKGSAYNDEQVSYYVSNIKVAKGVADTRHKLIDEGKFSTTGILFDVNAATIRPESNGVLKEIAEVLKKYPDVKVKVLGHTDSDGSDAANLALSKKRAEAVKQSLQSDYGIEEGRITTDGKGETEPVGDNKTREGKAANRRVEFIRQ